MDQETREMFEKIFGLFGEAKSDMTAMKSDVGTLKSDMAAMKSDVGTLKSDMTAMRSRQDEMYLILRGWEENRNIVKALEEKSLVATSEIDKLKVQTSKVIGAVRRSSQEALNGLADEVS